MDGEEGSEDEENSYRRKPKFIRDFNFKLETLSLKS